MFRDKKGEHPALYLALKELIKLRRMNNLEKFLFVLSSVSILFLIVFSLGQLLTTGYATYVNASAGTVTSMNIKVGLPVYYWHGIYGLALRVPGYFSQIYDDVDPGEITGLGVFFDCIQGDAPGGKEIYISEGSNINWDSLVPANASQVDARTGCSGKPYCADKTFLNKTWVMLGDKNITDIPCTFTYKWDGQNGVFDTGILWDGSNLVYVVHIYDLQQGYSNESTVNFQALLPVPPNSTIRYYFFNDPNDVCPAGGGIGETISANVNGYIKNLNGDPIEDARVIFTGFNDSSDTGGFYNVSSTVLPGNYSVLIMAEGYDNYIFSVKINSSQTNVTRNITLTPETIGTGETVNVTVTGYVKGSNGYLLDNAIVLLGDKNYTTSSDGYYIVSPILSKGLSPLVSYRQGYDDYYEVMNFTNDSIIYKNITLEQAVHNPFATGPYTEQGKTYYYVVKQTKNGEDYWVSTRDIKKEVRKDTFVTDYISLYNAQSSTLNLAFKVSESLDGVVELNQSALSIPPNSGGNVELTFYGDKPIGLYNGSISVFGDIEQEIPTEIKIVERRRTMETLLAEITLFNPVASPGDVLKYQLVLTNLLRNQGYDVLLDSYLESTDGDFKQFLGEDLVELRDTASLLKKVNIPNNLTNGDYQIKVEAKYLNLLTSVVAPLKVRKPVYFYSFLGVPLWIIFLIIFVVSAFSLIWILYKKQKEKKERYRTTLDVSTLPKKTERSLFLGKIAESRIPAYYPLDALSTHAIIAGATGGGKSISAQVVVEEALMKDTAVLVFDPTAQWSGMLRKCEDKKMLSYYHKFHLKKTDARAFSGNVHMVSNARELIDIKKYSQPGQIQIFTLNKLPPKDIDIFVANVIRGIFESNPKESENLKILLVFDEVHRLLARFGGSGEGFLQIERACREFRKWGMGVVLVSQVLSDFVGEIKANINTEIQMRTIEEGDLNRIKTKYGDNFLKSLVKSEVGVGMLENAEFNKGIPYFVNFRPILHNTRRLTDEELQKYNKYNSQVEQIEFEIETLEKKKVDVFDLKMELKLVKDKIMTGSFPVVDIYLQGLKPRLEKEWEKLGEKPPKLKKKLADLSAIKKSVEEAKKAREKYLKEQKSKKTEESKTNIKKEKPEDKIVAPLTFDNGEMVSSLAELKDVLPNLDDEFFKPVADKNGFSEWAKNVDEDLAKKLKGKKTKKEILQIIDNFIQGKNSKPKQEVEKTPKKK